MRWCITEVRAAMVIQPLSDHLKGQRDSLAATDTHRNDTPPESVSTH